MSGPADEREGDVAAQLGGELGQPLAGCSQLPQLVERHQRRSRVGGAAGHAARRGDPLVEGDGGAASAEQTGRARHQVGLVERDLVEVDVVGGGHRQRPVRRVFDRDLVVEADRLVDGVERVESVRAHGADAEMEVDLRGAH